MRSWKNNKDFFMLYLEKMEREIACWREIIIKQQSILTTLDIKASANKALSSDQTNG